MIEARAVLFDFDLTLADSSAGFAASHRHACECLNLTAPDLEAIRRSIGTPLHLVVPRFFPQLDEEGVAEYIRIYQARADSVMTPLTRMVPGACDALRRLKNAGLKLGLVSQKLRYRVEEVLIREDISAYFDVVLGAEDVPAFKPDPSGLLLALERLQATPEEALYVGDTTIDAEAAANAGLRFVAVLTGPTTRGEHATYDELAVLESVAQLPQLLELD
jgi:phosphoglycolate phosphatase